MTGALSFLLPRVTTNTTLFSILSLVSIAQGSPKAPLSTSMISSPNDQVNCHGVGLAQKGASVRGIMGLHRAACPMANLTFQSLGKSA